MIPNLSNILILEKIKKQTKQITEYQYFKPNKNNYLFQQQIRINLKKQRK